MSKAIVKTSAAISIPAGRLAIAAIVAYQILLIVLIFLRPDLDPSWHTISEWAIGPYGWLMSAALVISAVSYAALFRMLTSQVQGTMGGIGMGLLLICVAGALGAGIFTTDPMPIRPPLSTTGTLHVIFGTSQLMLLQFAALLINLSLARRNQRWARARRVLLWTAGLPLFGFGAFALYSAIFVFPMGRQAYGPGVNIGWPPRFAFFTYMLWVVILAWQGIKCIRLAHAQGHPNRRDQQHIISSREYPARSAT
ncbi:MAG: DUF998 domain-containing protein [Bryobacteraceae bacterium]